MDYQKIRADLKYDLEHFTQTKEGILPAGQFYLPIILTVGLAGSFFLMFPFAIDQIYRWLNPLEYRDAFDNWRLAMVLSFMQIIFFFLLFSGAIRFMMMDKGSLRSAGFIRSKIRQAIVFYLCLYMGIFTVIMFYFAGIRIGFAAYPTLFLSNVIGMLAINMEMERLGLGVVLEVIGNAVMHAKGKNSSDYNSRHMNSP